MIDWTILVVEIGYLGGAAALAQGVRFVARRIERARTRAALRRMLAETTEPLPPDAPKIARYRDNVATAAEAEEAPPTFVERWRAKRAAAYVHELERRANIDA